MSNRLEPAHYNNLDAIAPSAWSLLKRGARDPRAGSHTLQVATLNSEGLPTIRSVVLRGFDDKTRTLKFHTDSRSEKAIEIFDRPLVAVHVYDAKAKTQLRMQCRATLHHRDPVSASAWRAMREMNRKCYQQSQSPGSALEAPAQADIDPEIDLEVAYDNFAAVTAVIQRLEWLYLSESGHRRAAIDWRNGKETATWLAP